MTGLGTEKLQESAGPTHQDHFMPCSRPARPIQIRDPASGDLKMISLGPSDLQLFKGSLQPSHDSGLEPRLEPSPAVALIWNPLVGETVTLESIHSVSVRCTRSLAQSTKIWGFSQHLEQVATSIYISQAHPHQGYGVSSSSSTHFTL